MTENTQNSEEKDEQQPEVPAESDEKASDDAITLENPDKEGQNLDNGTEDEAIEAPPEEGDLDRDGLLADVRQTLISSDESKEPRRGFFQRLRGRRKKPSETEPAGLEEIETVPPETPSHEEVQVDIEEENSKASDHVSREQREEIESFFSDLEALTSDVDYEMLDSYVPEKKELVTQEEVDEQAVEQVEEHVEGSLAETVSIEDEAPRVATISDISVKPEEGTEEGVDLRELALQDYDESVIEPASEVKHPVGEVVRTTVREFKPVERFMVGFVFVVAVVLMLSAGVYFIASSVPQPTPTLTPVPSDIPYPVRVVLPGDWRIDLRKGRVVDGIWDPQGAEWLEGTEISRWVALPWSEQIEAVVRTFKRGDEVGLVMSNYDILTYRVDSIEEMNFEGLQSLDNRTPGLLLILPQENNEEEGLFWVVTALP
jgi:hypothetical protein